MKALPKFTQAAAHVLYARRASCGWSQDELSERSGIERTYISRLERGIHMPSLRALVLFGEVYGVPASEIVREIEEAYTLGLGLLPCRPRCRRKS